MSLAWFFQAENFLDQLPGSFFGSAPMLISGLSFADIKKDGWIQRILNMPTSYCSASVSTLYIKVAVVFLREFFKNRHHHFTETAPVCVKNNDTGFLLLYSILWMLQGHIHFL